MFEQVHIQSCSYWHICYWVGKTKYEVKYNSSDKRSLERALVLFQDFHQHTSSHHKYIFCVKQYTWYANAASSPEPLPHPHPSDEIVTLISSYIKILGLWWLRHSLFSQRSICPLIKCPALIATFPFLFPSHQEDVSHDLYLTVPSSETRLQGVSCSACTGPLRRKRTQGGWSILLEFALVVPDVSRGKKEDVFSKIT